MNVSKATAIIAALSLFSLSIAQPVHAQKSPKLAKCDGKKKRTANPYGTILPSIDAAKITSAGENPPASKSGVNVFEAPSSPPSKTKAQDKLQVPAIGAVLPQAHFASC